jgi:hypothetical protein
MVGEVPMMAMLVRRKHVRLLIGKHKLTANKQLEMPQGPLKPLPLRL